MNHCNTSMNRGVNESRSVNSYQVPGDADFASSAFITPQFSLARKFFDIPFSSTLVFPGESMSAEVARGALFNARRATRGNQRSASAGHGAYRVQSGPGRCTRRTLPVRARQL